MRVLLTYRREGDNKVFNDLAFAYEILRDHMTAEQRTRFEALKYVLGLGAVDAFTIGFTSTKQINETLEMLRKATA